MEYLAVLGRQPEISLAELEALFSDVRQISDHLATFSTKTNIDRLGGSLKLAVKLNQKPLDYLKSLPDGKITLGVSDYSSRGSSKSAQLEALKLKKILTRLGRSVRVVMGRDATLSTATSLHNGLSGKNPKKVELIKTNHAWYRVVGVQDIDAYTQRDQARPARDARVGMLPPKLAQILINLCGPLKPGSRILDPFCGTGVVLQEALLMGFSAYGTDINHRMVEYSKKNLSWLKNNERKREQSDLFWVAEGDATSFKWQPPIDAVACEGYLGQPLSIIPTDIKLKKQQQECRSIILGFLKNLSEQIQPGTPVTLAAPAWLRPDGTYARLDLFDFSAPETQEKLAFLNDLGYNVNNKTREGLFYHRDAQIVARDIIILRKK